jgi:hypothetical protein
MRLGFVGARTGELAVLCIIGDECRTHGTCCLHIDAMAARAGVCRSTAQNALCEARRLGLITRQERRRRGQPSLTNIVRIVSAEWRTWLDRGSSLRGRSQKVRIPRSVGHEIGSQRGKLGAFKIFVRSTGPCPGRFFLTTAAPFGRSFNSACLTAKSRSQPWSTAACSNRATKLKQADHQGELGDVLE